MGLFPAFFDRPAKMSLPDADPDEHIELLLRQHWVTNVPWIFFSLLGIVLPILLFNLTFTQNFINNWSVPLSIVFSLTLFWYMLLLANIINHYLYWYFNIYIVTNEHLIDICFQNLMNKNVTEVLLSDVQSARTQMRGVIGSLFNFGDLVVETAAEKQNIQFLVIPYPDLVKERIQELQEAAESGNPGGSNGP